MTLATDTVVIKDLLAAEFESALDKLGLLGNDRAKAVIDGFFPGAFSGVILCKQLILTPASFVAGVGTGADTNGTARRYNLGTALPAGAIITRHMIHKVTACNAVTSLIASIGVITPVDDFDTLVTTTDMKATAGYYQGTAGDAGEFAATDAIQAVYGGAQLTVSITPDAGEKVSAVTVGNCVITVFYLDAT